VVAWAGLLDGLGRHAESEPIYRRALLAWEHLGVPEEVAVCCNNLGALCAAQRRWPEAEAWYRRAVAIKRERLGPQHPDLALTLHNLAVLLKQMGRWAQARACITEALAICEERLAANHPHRLACSRLLARLPATA
jgi:tetratricopeptide (TPR) repeat protein